MGVIAGLVQVADCVKGDRSPWAFPEVQHWKLAEARAATRRVEVVGSLGLAAAPAGWQTALS
jgi:hypothetical protein